MRKFLATLLILVTSAILFVGCVKSNNQNSSSTPEPEKTTVTVTFIQEGQDNIIVTVDKGSALAEVPAPVAVKGHSVAWDKSDFSAIQADMTVNAVVTANKYTITFNYGESGFVGAESIEVAYGEQFKFPENKSENVVFTGAAWVDASTGETLEAGLYLFDKDITVNFTYESKDVYIPVD